MIRSTPKLAVFFRASQNQSVWGYANEKHTNGKNSASQSSWQIQITRSRQTYEETLPKLEANLSKEQLESEFKKGYDKGVQDSFKSANQQADEKLSKVVNSAFESAKKILNELKNKEVAVQTKFAYSRGYSKGIVHGVGGSFLFYPIYRLFSRLLYGQK